MMPAKENKVAFPEDAAADRPEPRSEGLLVGKTVILGVGNPLMRDEGVGVHIAHAFGALELPDSVAVVEGGTDGFRLMHIVMGVKRLIVVDAVKGGGAPGSIYRFELDEAPPSSDAFRTSVHQVGIQEVIDLMGLLDEKPPTTVIGIEPESLDMGLGLSDTIRGCLRRVYDMIFAELGLAAPSTIPDPPADGLYP